MSQAVFGLVGVLIGAFVTGGIDYVLQRRQERADLRVAARLVHAELHVGVSVIETAQARGVWFSGSDLGVPETSWLEHRATLARGIRDQAVWAQVVGAENGIRMLPTVIDEGEQLNDQTRKMLSKAGPAARAALTALSSLLD